MDLKKNDGRACTGLRIHFAPILLLVSDICYVEIHFEDQGEFSL